jgi:rod shape-determining protein MreB
VAQILFKHLINLATQGKPQDYIIRAVIGAPALANEQNKQALLDLTESMIEGAQIISEPFSVAYGLNLLNNCLIVDIGGGTVDLCRMQGVYPTKEDQLTTYKAGDYIDNVFFDLLDAKYPDANYTINMLRTFKEEHGLIGDTDEKLVLTLPICGKPTDLDLTDELRQACSAIVPEISDAIKYLISTYDPEFQEELKGNIILAGGGSQIIGLGEVLEKHMSESLGYGSVRKVPDPVYAGANGALMYCKDMPEDFWEEQKQARIKKTE